MAYNVAPAAAAGGRPLQHLQVAPQAGVEAVQQVAHRHFKSVAEAFRDSPLSPHLLQFIQAVLPKEVESIEYPGDGQYKITYAKDQILEGRVKLVKQKITFKREFTLKAENLLITIDGGAIVLENAISTPTNFVRFELVMERENPQLKLTSKMGKSWTHDPAEAEKIFSSLELQK